MGDVTRSTRRTAKRPFAFGVAIPRIRRALRTLDVPTAAMFALAQEGHTSVFEQIVACVISIRTRDEVSLPVALELFEHAPTPAAIAKLPVARIDRLIRASTFHRGKAETIRAVAKRTVDEFGGALPCDPDVLTTFKGVGPKCANLAAGVACGADRIAVDIHVHRVTNRWGVIAAKTPEQTMLALEKVLPKKYWV